MNSNTKVIVSVTSLLLVVCVCFYLSTGYGKVSSQGYAYSMALFSACNQKDEAKLQQIAVMIKDDLEAGKIDEPESRWLTAIIDDGLNGRWGKANEALRELMDAQVQYSTD